MQIVLTIEDLLCDVKFDYYGELCKLVEISKNLFTNPNWKDIQNITLKDISKLHNKSIEYFKKTCYKNKLTCEKYRTEILIPPYRNKEDINIYIIGKKHDLLKICKFYGKKFTEVKVSNNIYKWNFLE